MAGQCPPQRPGENAKTVNELRTELAASQARAREVESKFAENFVVTESEAKEIANERVKPTELEAELEKGQLAMRALKKAALQNPRGQPSAALPKKETLVGA